MVSIGRAFRLTAFRIDSSFGRGIERTNELNERIERPSDWYELRYALTTYVRAVLAYHRAACGTIARSGFQARFEMKLRRGGVDIPSVPLLNWNLIAHPRRSITHPPSVCIRPSMQIIARRELRLSLGDHRSVLAQIFRYFIFPLRSTTRKLD